jgi:hypothetical protein
MGPVPAGDDRALAPVPAGDDRALDPVPAGDERAMGPVPAGDDRTLDPVSANSPQQVFPPKVKYMYCMCKLQRKHFVRNGRMGLHTWLRVSPFFRGFPFLILYITDLLQLIPMHIQPKKF